MRRYETIFIVDPDLSEEGRVPVFDRVTGLIPDQGGTLLEMDEWGSRRLAYEIRKKTRGYYVRVDYCGSGAVVDEMERFFRIDDRVLKFITVLLDKEADVEQLLAEATAKQQPAAAPSETPQEETAAPVETDEKPAPPAAPDNATEAPAEPDSGGDATEPTQQTIEEA